MKKIISLLLAILMLGLSIPVYAEEVSPWYIYILHMSELFEISASGVATVSSDMEIRSSGAYCTAVAKVQKETASGGWNTVTTFRDTDDDYVAIYETIRLTSKGNYKCVFTFTVYDEYDFIIEQKSFTLTDTYT